MSVRYNVDILQCPACHQSGLQAQGEQLVCAACQFRYEVQNGIPVLLTDKTLATQLEKMDYDQHHNIDDRRREKVANDWQKIFGEQDVTYGNVLEIGSGTGQLTWGLARKMSFKSVSACDISCKFLDGIRSNLLNQPGDSHVNYYACDANNLPFKPGTFDLVLGHSVLHHFIDYDRTIHQAFNLLKPGGKAIFFEPVLQGKAIIAFFSDLMLRIEKRVAKPILTPEDVSKIEQMNRHILKAKWIGNDRERLKQIEDKHVFDISGMRKLAKEVGYSHYAYSNFYEADKGYKSHWAQHLLMQGIDARKIEHYAYICNSFGHVFSDLVNKDIPTPMGYFIFTK